MARAATIAIGLTLALAGIHAQKTPAGPAAPDLVYVVDSNDGAMGGRVFAVDPGTGQIVLTIATGHKPDAALSPDGSRLYVASSVPRPDQNHMAGILDVIDARTGQRLRTVDNPNRWMSTLPFYHSQMALSRDGTWLFQTKLAMPTVDDTRYYVDTFDTVASAFLPTTAPVPGCVTSLLLPPPHRRNVLGVACSHTQDVRWLTLSETGSPLDRRPPRLTIANGARHGHPGTAFVDDGGHVLTIVAPDGRFLKSYTTSPSEPFRVDLVDRAARKLPSPSEVTSAANPNDWLAGRWIRQQPAVLSPDRALLYVGLDSDADRAHGRQGFREVAVLDSERLERAGTIRLSRPVWSLAISGDGRLLYALDPHAAAMLVIDAATGQELRAIRPLGRTPILMVF